MSLFPEWLSENIGRRKRLLVKAENNLETLLDSEDERVKADMTKFVAKTIGKDEGYSEKTEINHKGEITYVEVTDKEYEQILKRAAKKNSSS